MDFVPPLSCPKDAPLQLANNLDNQLQLSLMDTYQCAEETPRCLQHKRPPPHSGRPLARLRHKRIDSHPHRTTTPNDNNSKTTSKGLATRNDFVNDIVNDTRADAIFATLKAIVDDEKSTISSTISLRVAWPLVPSDTSAVCNPALRPSSFWPPPHLQHGAAQEDVHHSAGPTKSLTTPRCP